MRAFWQSDLYMNRRLVARQWLLHQIAARYYNICLRAMGFCVTATCWEGLEFRRLTAMLVMHFCVPFKTAKCRRS